MRKPNLFYNAIYISTLIVAIWLLASCNSSSATGAEAAQPPQALPVVAVTQMPATVYQEYSASLEGSKDIEIRPQVDGYIEQIYVDEGARVRRGQVLFKINDRTYREQLNTAKAGLAAAKANLVSAQINVSKVKPLVDNNIVSDVQLKTAQAAYDAAQAQVAQAQAMVRNAQINLGYTLIKAPVDGYIGRIPLKIGSLVGMSTPEPLTVLSEVKDIYAYFSLSENDFIQFKNQYSGNTIEEKIKQLPPVELILADGTVYPKKGRCNSCLVSLIIPLVPLASEQVLKIPMVYCGQEIPARCVYQKHFLPPLQYHRKQHMKCRTEHLFLLLPIAIKL